MVKNLYRTSPWLELINFMKELSVLFDSYIAYALNLLSFQLP